MGQRLVIFDDLDGESAEDVETVQFGYRGTTFEIELTTVHRKELLDALVRFASSGRRRDVSCPGCRKILGTGRMDDELREALGDDVPPAVPADRSGPVQTPHLRRDVPRSMQKNPKSELEAVRDFAARFNIKVGKGRIADDVWEAWESDDLSRLLPGRLPSASNGESE